MVDVWSKTCASDECSRKPSYGVEGSRKAEYCVQHALKGMVNVYSQIGPVKDVGDASSEADLVKVELTLPMF